MGLQSRLQVSNWGHYKSTTESYLHKERELMVYSGYYKEELDSSKILHNNLKKSI